MSSSSSDDGSLNDDETTTSTDSHVQTTNTTQIGQPTAADIPTQGQIMSNNPNDEVHPVTDARNISTPVVGGERNPSTSLGPGAAAQQRQAAVAGGTVLANNPVDERVDVDGSDTVPTPRASDNYGGDMARHGATTNIDAAAEESEEEEEEEEEDEEADVVHNPPQQFQHAQQLNTMDPSAQPPASKIPGYDPARYASVNAGASREIQDLFKRILAYEPFVADLPVKLHPFIPDYYPTIGDLDPFVKVPRPDGVPDGLGLYVVDEPAIPQSNPAVVLLELRATNSRAGGAVVVDSYEDAANRPEVLDRWIADIKKVHYKKPLPTVNYQKPMPDIEQLMQVWPQEFEEFLNSDFQFPPPNIDLDMEQYVRTLCAILDIPTYTSLIDSLHVMFTLYEEFRVNQHFQHE